MQTDNRFGQHTIICETSQAKTTSAVELQALLASHHQRNLERLASCYADVSDAEAATLVSHGNFCKLVPPTMTTSYEIRIDDGTGTWEVNQNGSTVPGAHVKTVEFDEGYKDGPNGRTYYPIPGSGRGTIRLPDGTTVANVPLKL